MKNSLSVGTIVSHKCRYGMYRQTGIVVDSAGVRYGRKYFWVSYTDPATGKVWKSAFWDGVLKIQ